ncbi:GNAT family N-acetyltransferase [Rhodococcus sp. IEGM 1366]|uniref:GNAT family N-acetyltransferase n=1 Tax=Rhodococcus sp. IEGM 1366 TaxID=3082223 RepID=UPI00295439B2|nr:GNAT family N-acetyltransferase [Rhodococcus sp. IEGM 1366]MDV8065546.1 GNAT family N-acetyltransferase [Rhodococcus sp. IEGM 1366]
MSVPWERVERLSDEHALDEFCCEDPDMDKWFINSSRQQDSAGGCAVHVCVNADERVVGFFTLTSIEIRGDSVSKGASSGMTIVPSTLLGRLALDGDLRGQGIGAILMLEALHATCLSTKYVASRLAVLDAKNEKLVERYKELGFNPTKTDPLRMWMRISTAKKTLEAAGYAL